MLSRRQSRNPSHMPTLTMAIEVKTANEAPVPTDPRVALVGLPAMTVAALRFSGSRDDASVEARTAELVAALGASGWAPVGDASALFYDPPWTIPMFRRNEVMVPGARR